MSKYLNNVGKAHQRVIRESAEIADKQNLFGEWWKDIDTSLDNAEVKPIDYNSAKKIIEQYEWLGCMPAFSSFFYGIFFDGQCGGVTVFGTEYAENLGVWDKYGYTGKLILLARGVCVHWTPKNSGSKLIMESIKLLPEQYKVVTCTIDRLAGEIGTIYQACNFHYVGSMRMENENCKNVGERFGVMIKGKMYGSRSIRAKIGSQKKEDILRYYPDAEFVPQLSKERYFYFRGNRKENKELKNAIQHMTLPYPKRAVEDSRESRFNSVEEGEVQFLSTAPNLTSPHP